MLQSRKTAMNEAADVVRIKSIPPAAVRNRKITLKRITGNRSTARPASMYVGALTSSSSDMRTPTTAGEKSSTL